MKYSKLCACVSDVMRNHEGSRRLSNKRSGWVAECVIVFVRLFSVCLCRLSLVFQTVSLGRGGCPVMDPISSILLTANTFITARDLGDNNDHLPASNRNPRKVPTTRLVSSPARLEAASMDPSVHSIPSRSAGCRCTSLMVSLGRLLVVFLFCPHPRLKTHM